MSSASESALAAEAEAIRSAPRLKRCLWGLRHHDRPVQFLIGRVLMASGLSPLIRIHHNGYDLRFYDSSLSLELWLHPAEKPGGAERFFRRYLRRGDVVVDVGVNIGLYTMICAVSVGDSGKVYAIEPNPRVAGYLRGNITLNRSRNVQVHNVALGEREGSVRFSDQGQDDRNCVVDDDTGQEVPVVRLDSLPIRDQTIALLKIDVEGYEKFVLDGATGVLPGVQCVFIETWEEHFSRYGYPCVDVHQRLLAHGFRLFRFRDEALCEVEPGYVSLKCEDLVGVRDVHDFTARTGYPLP